MHLALIKIQMYYQDKMDKKEPVPELIALGRMASIAQDCINGKLIDESIALIRLDDNAQRRRRTDKPADR